MFTPAIPNSTVAIPVGVIVIFIDETRHPVNCSVLSLSWRYCSKVKDRRVGVVPGSSVPVAHVPRSTASKRSSKVPCEMSADSVPFTERAPSRGIADCPFARISPGAIVARPRCSPAPALRRNCFAPVTTPGGVPKVVSALYATRTLRPVCPAIGQSLRESSSFGATTGS
jgi:hypothetical protein